jgi:VCBS repeat-containing protein
MNKHLRRSRRHSRSLRLERLESRVVLDGNVHAFVSGGSLHLDGDSHNNEITIEQFAPKNFTVSSRDGTTTINGQAGPLTFSRVSKNLFVTLKGGSDVAELDGGAGSALVVRNGLFVDMGSGADQLLMSNVHVLRLHVNMGTGNDLVNIGDDGITSGVMVTKEAIVVTGSGQDDARVANSIFKRFLNLDMGNNNDTTTIQNTSVRRRSVINGGPGTDTLNRESNHGKLKFLSYEIVNNSVMSPAPIPPVAGNDTATVTRGQNTIINVAANDIATGGNTINNGSITITQPPAHGTAAANNDGTVTYTNNGDAAATDTFKYTIKDSAGTTSNAATVAITVNAPLLAVNDTGSVTEDATPNTATGNVLTNDTGGTGTKTVSAVNGNAASVGQNVPGTHGTFHINADGAFTYTLNNNDEMVNGLNDGQTLPDSIGYTAKAGNETSNATLTITITGRTDLAAAADAGSVTEDTGPNPVTGNVTTNDTHATGTTLTVTEVKGSAANVGTGVTGDNGFGTFTVNANGGFTYQLDNTNATINGLNDGETRTDTVTYKVSDGTQTSTATVTITITGRTDLAAAADAASVTEDTGPNPVTGNVLTNDAHAAGTTLTVTQVKGLAGNVGTPVTGANSFGTFTINANGSFTYQLDNTNATINALNDGETRTDSIAYTTSDGTQTSTATLTITITGRSDLSAAADAGSVTEDTGPNPVTGNVTTNDTHATGTTLTVTEVKGSAANVGTGVTGDNGFGTFTVNANGSFTYQLDNTNATINGLNDGETRTDTVTYKVSDGTQTSTATVTITITGRTDLAAAADTADITEDASPDSINGNVVTNDTHAAGTTLTVTEVNGSAAGVDTDVPGMHGTFHIMANGSFTYELNNADTNVNDLNDGQTLPDSIDYTVSDGTQTSTATLTVTIHGTTELQANADANDITEDAATPNTTTGNVLDNDTGGPSPKSVTAVDSQANNVGMDVPGKNGFGTFHINSNGTYTYTLDDTNPTVDNLNDGGMLTDFIDYTVTSGLSTDTGTLTITIHGHTDV